VSKKPKTKKIGVKELLALLGADPNEAIPTGLREAEWATQLEGCEHEPVGLGKCSTTSKVMFLSFSQAKAASKRRLKRGSNANAFRIYLCPDCSHFHMTSQVKRS
jgi:hypothetical protein